MTTYTASDGTEFENIEDYKKYEFETRYTIRQRQAADDEDPILEQREPGEIDGQPFDLSDLNNCVVVLLDHTDQVQIANVHNSRIFIGACQSLVFVANCSNCTFTVATKQFRAKDVHDCCFFLYSMTDPVIESSTSLEFGPFNGAYAEHAEHLRAAGLDPSIDKWWKIEDVTPSSTTGGGQQQQPHYRLITMEEWRNGASVEPWLPEGPGSAEPVVPLTWPPQATWQMEWEEKLKGKEECERAHVRQEKDRAQEELDQFYDKRTDLYAHRQARNRELEQLFLEKIESDEKEDNPFARVLALIGGGGGQTGQDDGGKVDKSRFRSLLFDLRERAPPSLAEGKRRGSQRGGGAAAGREEDRRRKGSQVGGGGGAGEDDDDDDDDDR